MRTILWSSGPHRLELWYSAVLVLIEHESTILHVVHVPRAAARPGLELDELAPEACAEAS